MPHLPARSLTRTRPLRALPWLAAAALAATALPTQAATPAWLPSLPPTYAGLSQVSVFADGTGFAARPDTDPQGRTLWRTADGGLTWAEVLPLPGTIGSETRFADARTGYLADRTLLRTDDAGRTWRTLRPLAAERGRADRLDDVAVAGTDTVAVSGALFRGPLECGDDRGVTTGVVAVSRDRGASWRSVETAAGRAAYDVAVRTDGSGAALTERDVRDTEEWRLDVAGRSVLLGCTFELDDRAEAAVEVFDAALGALRPVLACRAVPCTSVAAPAPGVLVVGRADGSVTRTTDGGATWTTSGLGASGAPEPAAQQPLRVDGLAFADPSTGYAATRAGGVFRTTDGGATWVEEVSAQEVPGIGLADVAAAGGHALLQGPGGISRRTAFG